VKSSTNLCNLDCSYHKSQIFWTKHDLYSSIEFEYLSKTMTCKNNNEKQHDLMLKVCLKWLPSAAMQSCAIPWLHSLIKTVLHSYPLPQLLIPRPWYLILLNAVLQNSPPHSRWALDMYRLLDGHRECGINFRRLRVPVLDMLGPCPAGKWSTQNIWVTFHKLVYSNVLSEKWKFLPYV